MRRKTEDPISMRKMDFDNPQFHGCNDKQLLADPKLQELSLPHHKLVAVYGDTLHHNDGTHLDGGIENNKRWQIPPDHPQPLLGWSELVMGAGVSKRVRRGFHTGPLP